MSEWTKIKAPNTRQTRSKTNKKENVASTPKPSGPGLNKIDTSKIKGRKPLREKNSNGQNSNSQNTNSSDAKSSKSSAFIPKSIDDCNRAIGTVEEVIFQINLLRNRTPDRPNVWLNELVSYFVTKCCIKEKEISRDQYLTPDWINLTPKMETLLVSTLKDNSEFFIKPHVRATLFHESLLNLVEESCHNNSIAGYKLMIYLLSKHFGNDCVKSISDRICFHASQAHAYRSNPNTCIPLLWSMGLPFLFGKGGVGLRFWVGRKFWLCANFGFGEKLDWTYFTAKEFSIPFLASSQSIEVFEKAMLPLLEFKPTNHYVVYFLESIVNSYLENNQGRLQLFSPNSIVKICHITYWARFYENLQFSGHSSGYFLAIFGPFLGHSKTKNLGHF